MGLKEDLLEDCDQHDRILLQLQERPLYFWLKSFAGREIDEDAVFSDFVTSNALTYALEYIGITSENEQSSLHLSAIFDEENQQQSKNKYPTHYESETKSRIQNLNRVFIELKSYFEDHYSQIVAIRPPNSVHITSACSQCSVIEFEKLLFLILGAAIQGTQKQDTIRKIKRFPTKIQESLIECIKLIADNPELLNVKSWQEFQTLILEEQRKIYDALLGLIRKLILERNELTQNQLLTDYFAGYMNCDQKRIYESRGCTVFADFEKNAEDARLSSSLRHLREQLHEKSELLQECREELEAARNQIQDLESEVNEMQQKHRSMKKARDELDALREGQDKATRLEAELLKMKSKLEETEQIYERVETLEIENRNLQVKHDILLDQLSFLSLEKTSRDNSYNNMTDYTGLLDGIGLGHKFKEDDGNFFDSDEEEPSVKENPNSSVVDESKELDQSTSTIQLDTTQDHEEIIERPISLNISQTDCVDCSAENLVASTPKGIEQKSQEVQTPTQYRTKRRRRPSLLNLKRTRKAIIIPLSGGQSQKKLPSGDKIPEGSPSKNHSSHTIQLYKVYSVDKRKGSSRPKKFKSPTKIPIGEQQIVPNVDNEGNEADEELSLSPTGIQNGSDVDSNNENAQGTDDNDSEIYFVCSPPTSTGTTTPRRNHFGTTTAFPISNGSGQPRTTHHHIDFDSLNNTQSNHLTVYSRNTNQVPSSPTTTVHVPLMKISHEVQIGQSDTDEGLRDDEDAANAFTFGDYNIQLNLRNTSIKPSTALINKISTLSANLNPDHNFNNQYPSQTDHNYLETSSEEDGSVWYEYGCV